MNININNYDCYLCEYKSNCFSESTGHLRYHLKGGAKIKCPMKNCELEFTVQSSFRSHCFRKHKNTQNKYVSHSVSQSYTNHVNNQQPNISLDIRKLDS